GGERFDVVAEAEAEDDGGGAFGEPLTLRLGPARGLAARVVAAVEEDVVGRERRLAARCRFERQRRGCADLGRELRIERAQVLLEVSGHVESRSAVQAPCQRQCAVSGRTWPLVAAISAVLGQSHYRRSGAPSWNGTCPTVRRAHPPRRQRASRRPASRARPRGDRRLRGIPRASRARRALRRARAVATAALRARPAARRRHARPAGPALRPRGRTGAARVLRRRRAHELLLAALLRTALRPRPRRAEGLRAGLRRAGALAT